LVTITDLQFNSTVRGRCARRSAGRVFTLLDVTWSAMRLVSLALGGVLVDTMGIQPLFWTGGSLLAIAGVLGLMLFGRYAPRTALAQVPS
jgi:hypothetical protein